CWENAPVPAARARPVPMPPVRNSRLVIRPPQASLAGAIAVQPERSTWGLYNMWGLTVEAAKSPIDVGALYNSLYGIVLNRTEPSLRPAGLPPPIATVSGSAPYPPISEQFRLSGVP